MDGPRVGPVLVQRILVTAAADAGIGEEDIARTVAPLGLGHEMANVGFLADVAGDGDALDVLGDGLETAGVAVGDHDAFGTLQCIAPRNRLADAASGTGDDTDLVFDFHWSLLVLSQTSSLRLAHDNERSGRLPPALLDQPHVLRLGRLTRRRLVAVIADAPSATCSTTSCFTLVFVAIRVSHRNSRCIAHRPEGEVNATGGRPMRCGR